MNTELTTKLCWAMLVLGSISLRADQPPATQPRQFEETETWPLILPSPEQTVTIRERVKRDRAVAAIFRRDVLDPADAALKLEPTPIQRIIYEGRVSGDPERVRSIEHLRDMPRISAMVWAAAISADDRYAAPAVRWTMAWVTTCTATGNDVNDNKLDALLFATKVLGPGMSGAQRDTCIAWGRDLGQKQAHDMENSHANRMAKRIKLVAAAARVTGDKGLRAQAVMQYKRFVGSELRPDGRSSDLERRDAMSYHVAGLKNILEAAILLQAEWFDPWSYTSADGASVQKSVEFVNLYARGEKIYAEWVHSKIDLDRRRWEAGDDHYRPGKPWDPRRSLEMYRLAATFDIALKPTLETVRGKADVDLVWLDIVLQKQ